jgi:hypothetical protein
MASTAGFPARRRRAGERRVCKSMPGRGAGAMASRSLAAARGPRYDRRQAMPLHHRRAFRHAVSIPCQVVRARDFRLVADVALDLSTAGMRVPTAQRVLTGEDLLVSFRAPRSGAWIDAGAVVARVVHGRRPGDTGRSLGLVFHDLGPEDRQMLFGALKSLPPVARGGARGGHGRRTEA